MGGGSVREAPSFLFSHTSSFLISLHKNLVMATFLKVQSKGGGYYYVCLYCSVFPTFHSKYAHVIYNPLHLYEVMLTKFIGMRCY